MASYSLLFDFDGVIMDTNDLHYLSRKIALEQEWVALSHEEYITKFNGMRRDTVIKTIFWQDVSDERMNRVSTNKQHALEHALHEGYELKILPWVKEFVQYLQNKGISYWIWSSSANARKFIELSWNKNLFPSIITWDMVKQGKPHPEIFTTLADLLGQEYKNCIVIEDSKAGIQAAQTAQMKTVGITHSWEIQDTTPWIDLIINNLSEYQKIISYFEL